MHKPLCSLHAQSSSERAVACLLMALAQAVHECYSVRAERGRDCTQGYEDGDGRCTLVMAINEDGEIRDVTDSAGKHLLASKSHSDERERGRVQVSS